MNSLFAKIEPAIDRLFGLYLKYCINPLWGWRSWRNWLSLISVILLVSWMLVCMFITSAFSVGWTLEIFKWTQFFCMLLIVYLLLRRFSQNISVVFALVAIFIYALLITYYTRTYTHLTYVFVARNFSDIGSIKDYIVLSLLLIIIVSLCGTYLLHKVSHHLWYYRPVRVVILLLALSAFFLPYDFCNEVVVFAQTAYNRSPIIDYYQSFYDRLLQQSADNKGENLVKWQARGQQPVPSYLDNIIFLHLESFNGQLVSASITPNFYNFAAANYSFPKFYANNIQTIYGQENILCSMPGSFKSILVETGEDKKILCLPEMLKVAGYRTFFAKAGELSFSKTGQFMQDIGFNETHSADLMQPNDPKYEMGYREDVFYGRVFDYLQTNPAPRNFIYLAVSGTSHWPFDLPKDITPAQKAGLPYPKTENFEQILSNNTYLQDSYLSIALQRIEQLFPEHNYTLIIGGDHAWPLGQHQNNIFIGADCFEENFTTSLAVKVGQESAYQSKVATSPYSQMDIVPSLMQLFGLSQATSTFQRSFFAPDQKDNYKIITVQPVANQCFNVIDLKDNSKLRYDIIYNKADIFDLNNDAEEKLPQAIITDNKNIPTKVKERLDFAAPSAIEKITN